MSEGGKNISVVLVSPQSAGNVGSVARVMANTGLTDLRLVDPVEYLTNDAFCMACNAIDTLKSAKVFPTLAEAVADAPLTLGATRRRGKWRRPMMTLTEAVGEVGKHSAANRVALVFGREDRGLLTDEIPLCDILFEIPSDDAYPSYNLSHAVLLTAFSVFVATGGAGAEEPEMEKAERGEVVKMFVHFESVLRSLDYGDRGGEHLLKTVMKNLRRLFGRTTLAEKEVNMLRGILARIDEKTGKG